MQSAAGFSQDASNWLPFEEEESVRVSAKGFAMPSSIHFAQATQEYEGETVSDVFFPGVGVEQELPDILGQLSWLCYHTYTRACTHTHTRKEKKSQFTLQFSLLSSASSFNFCSRTVGQNISQVITSALSKV